MCHLVNTLQARECRHRRRDGASERASSSENLGFSTDKGGHVPPYKHLTGARVPPSAARRREYALRKGVLLVASGLLPACAGPLLTPIRAPSSKNQGFSTVRPVRICAPVFQILKKESSRRYTCIHGCLAPHAIPLARFLKFIVYICLSMNVPAFCRRGGKNQTEARQTSQPKTQ